MMHISYDFLQNIFEIDSFHRVLFFINTKNTEKKQQQQIRHFDLNILLRGFLVTLKLAVVIKGYSDT